MRNYLLVAVVLILGLPSIFPFLLQGFFTIHDDTQVARVFEMGQSLRDGMFPVRWVKDLGYGYGYPIFNFYSPLPYYIGGVLTLFSIDALLATKIVFIIGTLLSAVFMYLLVKSFSDEISALFSAIIYLYFPYHAVNIYIRGALGELYAYGFLPLVFYGLFNIYRRFKSGNKSKLSKWIIITALGLFFVILSHNLYSFMLGLCLIVFFLLLLFTKPSRQLLLPYFLAVILGIGLSAFFVIPAFFEMKYTNVSSQIGGGADFRDHFVCVNQLWDSEWGFGGSIKGCFDGMSFKLGKMNIILLVTSLLVIGYGMFKRKMKERFIYILSMVLLLFTTFMSLEISKSVWEAIPYIDFVQYPWRFIGFIGLFLSFIAGVGFYFLKEYLGKTQFMICSLILIFLILISNSKLFQPNSILNKDSKYYTNLDFIRWNVSKVSDEYLPQDFIKPATNLEVPKSIFSTYDPDIRMRAKSEKTNYLRYEINSRNNASLRLNVAYYPAWKLYLDGKQISYGWNGKNLFFDVPDGQHNLELKFEETQIERTSNIISILSFLIILTVIFQKKSSYFSL